MYFLANIFDILDSISSSVSDFCGVPFFVVLLIIMGIFLLLGRDTYHPPKTESEKLKEKLDLKERQINARENEERKHREQLLRQKELENREKRK